jgi:hypothetical protein
MVVRKRSPRVPVVLLTLLAAPGAGAGSAGSASVGLASSLLHSSCCPSLRHTLGCGVFYRGGAGAGHTDGGADDGGRRRTINVSALCPGACGGGDGGGGGGGGGRPAARRRGQQTGAQPQNATAGVPGSGIGASNEALNQEVATDAAATVDGIVSGDSGATGAAGVMVRLIPIAMSGFVTFFGTKISTVVRVASVFFTSAAPSLIPAINQIKEDGGLEVESFLGKPSLARVSIVVLRFGACFDCDLPRSSLCVAGQARQGGPRSGRRQASAAPSTPGRLAALPR